MKKIFKAVVTAVSLVACLGAFAFGSSTKASADLHWTTMEKLEGRTPECALFLEEAKIKNMTDWGYYNVDGQDVWYFSGDNKGGEKQNPEIRFITEGTQTKSKPYTFDPMRVDSFSFEYRIDNNSQYKRVDDVDTQYIVQILASDGTYPIILPEIKADGGWHTINVDQWTPVTNASGNTYKSVDHLFSGFLFKMAGLDGELMIANIQLKSNGADVPVLNPYDEPELPEDSVSELPEASEEPETPDIDSVEPETSNDIYLESEEPASESLWMDDEEEEPTSEQPQTSEQPEESAEGGVMDKVMQTLGCASTIGGSSVLLTLAGAGIMMAIRKKKD